MINENARHKKTKNVAISNRKQYIIRKYKLMLTHVISYFIIELQIENIFFLKIWFHEIIPDVSRNVKINSKYPSENKIKE